MFTLDVHAAPPHKAAMDIRLFLGGRRPPKPSHRVGGWGNPVSPSPCGAGAWGNRVSSRPSPRAYVHVSVCGAPAPLPTFPRRGEAPDSLPPAGGGLGRGAVTFVATDCRLSRGLGKPGFPRPSPGRRGWAGAAPAWMRASGPRTQAPGRVGNHRFVAGRRSSTPPRREATAYPFTASRLHVRSATPQPSRGEGSSRGWRQPRPHLRGAAYWPGSRCRARRPTGRCRSPPAAPT